MTSDHLGEIFHQPPEDPDTPRPPETTGIAVRRRVADLLRKAVTFLDPDPLVTPGSPNGRDSNAGPSGSGSQTPVGGSNPDMWHHIRHGSSGSSGSEFLEVPTFFPPIAAVVASPEQQPF